jgi:hypothetical protein
MNGKDPDGVPTWQIPAEGTAVEGRMELNAELPMMPSGWGVREALSYDLPYLWPAEYEATLRRFEQADTPARAAFLRRTAVRRCVLPATESRQFHVVAEVPDWNMRVFECNAGRRARSWPAASSWRPTPPISCGSAKRSLIPFSRITLRGWTVDRGGPVFRGHR